MTAAHSWRHVLGAAGLSLALAGCATWTAPAAMDAAALRARAVRDHSRNVSVSAAVLSADDSRRMFGFDVNRANVQPVWIEVRNDSPQPLLLLRTGTDPDYFSPLEVAWAMHAPFDAASNARIDEHFDGLGIKNPIPPGGTRAGIVFTNRDRRTKPLNVDLLGKQTLIPFTLFLPVPDDGPAPPLFRYPESQLASPADLTVLRAALEGLPCCAADASGGAEDDPLNVVFIGEAADIAAALVRRSYRRDPRAADMSRRVFGRPPDVVARKQAQAGAPATWMRAWLAPIRFEGRSVYVAQVGRPVGGRFAPRDSAPFVLHEDVDEARNLLIQDMMYSGGLDKLGFVHGVGSVAEQGERYHTDGLRAVLFFATRPLSLRDVELLPWVPYLERRAGAASEESDEARERSSP
jgi:hypothetical protein